MLSRLLSQLNPREWRLSLRASTDSTPSFIGRLPAEILREIFRKSITVYDDDWRTLPSRKRLDGLKAYCLVCKAWAATAMPLLYSSIVLSTRIHDSSSQMILSLRKYGLLVKALDIQDSGHPSAPGSRRISLPIDRRKQLFIDLIISTLSLCPNIQEVRLSCRAELHAADFDPILDALSSKERLDTFFYRAVPPAGSRLTVQDLSQIFRSIPYLKHITANGLDSKTDAVVFPKMEALRSLSLHDFRLSGDDLASLLNATPYLESLYLRTSVGSPLLVPLVQPVEIHIEDDIAKALVCTRHSLRRLHLNLSRVLHSHQYTLQAAVMSLMRLETFVCQSDPRGPSFFHGDVFRQFPPALHKFRIRTPVQDFVLVELARIISELQQSNTGKWNLAFSAQSEEWRASEAAVLAASRKRGFAVHVQAKLGDSQVILDIIELESTK